MSNDLFVQDASTQTPPASQDSLFAPFANQLMDIKNEKGEPKYANLSVALDALKHSQEFIPQLQAQKAQYEAELAQLKEELAKRSAVEDVVARLSSQRQPEVPQPTSEATKVLDETQIQDLMMRTLTQREQAQVAQSNTLEVSNALTAKFGDKAKEVVDAKAKELGLTPQQLGKLAESSPKAVLSWFNTSYSSAPSGSPVRSSVHLPSTAPEQELKRPEKSLLAGASSKDVMEFMRKVKEDVYRKNGIDF